MSNGTDGLPTAVIDDAVHFVHYVLRKLVGIVTGGIWGWTKLRGTKAEAQQGQTNR